MDDSPYKKRFSGWRQTIEAPDITVLVILITQFGIANVVMGENFVRRFKRSAGHGLELDC